MPNENKKAYALTTLCPLLSSASESDSPTVITRNFLNETKEGEDSPMAKVPETYMSRFAVLSDVLYEGRPAKLDHLKSDYLIFVCEFHGDLESYLTGMWTYAKDFVERLWENCVDFKGTNNASAFVRYIRRCQVDTTFFFNGSTDDSLEEQLKGLYLKQKLSQFAYENQGLPPDKLQQAFSGFVAKVCPSKALPSWSPGQSRLREEGVQS